MKSEVTYYELLGLPQDADRAAIRKAYVERARLSHPDVNSSPDAPALMRDLNEAYATLSDPLKREAYDRRLAVKAPEVAVWQGAEGESEKTPEQRAYLKTLRRQLVIIGALSVTLAWLIYAYVIPSLAEELRTPKTLSRPFAYPSTLEERQFALSRVKRDRDVYQPAINSFEALLPELRAQTDSPSAVVFLSDKRAIVQNAREAVRVLEVDSELCAQVNEASDPQTARRWQSMQVYFAAYGSMMEACLRLAEAGRPDHSTFAKGAPTPEQDWQTVLELDARLRTLLSSPDGVGL